MKNKSAAQTARKRTRKVILLTMTGLTLLTSAAFGATTIWRVGTGSWFDPASWDPGEPHSMTDALINNGGTAQISANAPMAEALSLTLGLNAGDSGTVQELPPHGDLSVGGAIFVGKRGTGNLTSTIGTITSATASIASLTGGLLPPSYGAATIDGTNTMWIVTGRFDVGGYNDSPGGVALLSVTNGGTASAGSLRVYNSGTLTGNGTVSTTSVTTVAGTLAPKGQLTINSDLTFSGNAATMECNVVPTGADNVNVSGIASLTGRLSVTMTGTFTAGTTYTLLHAAGTVSGTFPIVSVKYPTGGGQCFTAVITYDAHNVYLYLSPCSG